MRTYDTALYVILEHAEDLDAGELDRISAEEETERGELKDRLGELADQMEEDQ